MSDLINRQAAIDVVKGIDSNFVRYIEELPSARPEYYDYSDIDDVWEYYAEEQDIKLTDNAKQLKDAMWVGYRKGKQDAQPSAHPLNPCETCLHKGNGWDEDPCDGCTGTESKYEPDNGWIPVSERLPEEGRCVLVTVHPDYIAPGILAVEKLNYYNGEWVSYDGERLEKFPDPIIAWMPLPDPYKGEE